MSNRPMYKLIEEFRDSSAYDIIVEIDKLVSILRNKNHREGNDDIGLYILAFIIEDHELLYLPTPHFTEHHAIMHYLGYANKVGQSGPPRGAKIFKLENEKLVEVHHIPTGEDHAFFEKYHDVIFQNDAKDIDPIFGMYTDRY